MIKYIDLFAGIGGFHQALKNIGGFECSFASEIDKDASMVYKNNHGLNPKGDITKIHEKSIPTHDLLCAGFPCQPFSKSGTQQGFEDIRGTLFFDIIRIANAHKPKVLLLENVANISSHDNGNTIKVIRNKLTEIGYNIHSEDLILNPLEFGIPVNRPRTFIIAIENSQSFSFTHFYNYLKNSRTPNKTTSIFNYFNFEENSDISLQLTDYQKSVLQMWDDFYQNIDIKTIGFPIWYEYFTQKPSSFHPLWKKTIITKNNKLYSNNKEYITKWEKKYNHLKWVKPTHKKFEWNCGESISSVFEGLIQFRPSGVRVKKPDFFSTLVAMNHPQYIGMLNRRLSPKECQLLQSFPENFIQHPNEKIALKQLGNSVNVKLIEIIVKAIYHHLDFQES